MKFKKLKNKMVVLITVPLIIILGIVSVVVINSVSNSNVKYLSKQISDEATIAQEQINSFFLKYITVVDQANNNLTIINYFKTLTDRGDRTTNAYYRDTLLTMDNVYEVNKDNLLLTWIADIEQNSIFHSTNSGWVGGEDWTANTRPWYPTVVNEKRTFITDPYVSAATGKTIVSLVSPVIDNATGKTIGVFGADLNIQGLPEMMKKFYFSEENCSVLIAGDGTIIYHPNSEYVLKNIDETLYSDDIKTAVKDHKPGSYSFGFDKTDMVGSLSVIPSNGWMVLSQLPQSYITNQTTAATIQLLILFIVTIVLLIIIVLILSSAITKPINKMSVVADEIAKGNFNIDIEVIGEDEIGHLARSFDSATKNYKSYIEEISDVLRAMAQSNLTKELTLSYIGDFQNIKINMQEFIRIINETLSGINLAADQVSSGSDQVASGSQALAQGATEQSASVQELSENANKIATQVKHNAQKAARAKDMVIDTETAINTSYGHMQKLMQAMDDIHNRSSEISKIIKTIEDIAFQTNILALNAAVEAARAGAAGKGFAVVADEVRNLAGKSAEAAKNTTSLIERSVHSINEGVSIADVTAKALQGVVDGVVSTTGLVSDISVASDEQAVAISQITIGLNQISAVVQTNSATSEESAAASQELFSQASLLKELVSRFKLKQTNRI